MNFTVIIPARFASTRFPGKPLIDLGGKPMVVRVAERARQSKAQAVVVATDDARIQDACLGHQIDVVMTATHHATGTDRLSEAAETLQLSDDAIVVNVQGDEPLIPPALIDDMAALLDQTTDAAIATLCHPIHERAEFFNPNVVKVVLDRAGYALYFSRAPIPYARDAFMADASRQSGELPHGLPAMRHIGLYAYRVGFLRAYPQLSSVAIEGFEALEQLRALSHGHKIIVKPVDAPLPPGIDTPEDYARIRGAFEK
jgi:3-deoxy-manno-octulosonate cytidylyltransferase (CMP-KDO synthetase)